MPKDLHALVADTGANLIGKSNFQIDKAATVESDSSLNVKSVQDDKSSDAAPRVVGKEDLVKALERSKKRNASALGAPKVISGRKKFTS